MYVKTLRQAPANETQSDRIRLGLEEDILAGVLTPGEKLDEASIAMQYGMSRTPVREAIKNLASSGLVELRPYRGAYVAMLSERNIMEMFEMMVVLECACIEFATKRCTSADIRDLEAALEICIAAEKDGDIDRFVAANEAFHQGLVQASHNSYIENQMLHLWRRLEVYRRRISDFPGLMAAANVEHQEILMNLRATDADMALQALKRHMSALKERIPTLFQSTRRRD